MFTHRHRITNQSLCLPRYVRKFGFSPFRTSPRIRCVIWCTMRIYCSTFYVYQTENANSIIIVRYFCFSLFFRAQRLHTPQSPAQIPYNGMYFQFSWLSSIPAATVHIRSLMKHPRQQAKQSQTLTFNNFFLLFCTLNNNNVFCCDWKFDRWRGWRAHWRHRSQQAICFPLFCCFFFIYLMLDSLVGVQQWSWTQIVWWIIILEIRNFIFSSIFYSPEIFGRRRKTKFWKLYFDCSEWFVFNWIFR